MTADKVERSLTVRSVCAALFRRLLAARVEVGDQVINFLGGKNIAKGGHHIVAVDDLIADGSLFCGPAYIRQIGTAMTADAADGVAVLAAARHEKGRTMSALLF